MTTKIKLVLEFETFQEAADALQNLGSNVVAYTGEINKAEAVIIPNDTEIDPVHEDEKEDHPVVAAIKETFTDEDGNEPVELQFTKVDVQETCKRLAKHRTREEIHGVIHKYAGRVADLKNEQINDVMRDLEALNND